MAPSTSAVDQLWRDVLENSEIQLKDPKIKDIAQCVNTSKAEEWAKVDSALSKYLDSRASDFRGFRRLDSAKMQKVREGLKTVAKSFHDISDMIGQGVSLAFAPAGIIVSAITHFTGACLAVSSDFDLIDQLFGIMSSFSRRLHLIKSSMPAETDYQNMIRLVFCRILDFSNSINTIISKGGSSVRLQFFGKALLRGEDPALKSSYGAVIEAIEDLDKATVMQSLALAVETERQTAQIGTVLVSFRSEYQRDQYKEKQRRETQERKQNEWHREHQQFMATVISHITNTSHANPDRTVSGRRMVRKPVVSSVSFIVDRHMAERLDEASRVHIKGTFDWIRDESGYKALCSTKSGGQLDILGRSGMGKSILAFVIFRDLSTRFGHLPGQFVAYFPFDKDNENLWAVSSMLDCCASQIALQDADYRTDLKESEENKENGKRWDTAFKEQFSQEQPERTLFLILDGVDHLEESELSKLADHVAEARAENLRINFILLFSSDTGNKKREILGIDGKPDEKRWRLCLDSGSSAEHEMDHGEETASTTTIQAGRASDFRHVASAHLERFSSLSSLPPAQKQIIIERIQEKADNFFYIDHALRMLNGKKIWAFVHKAVSTLAESTEYFYNDLFANCTQVYTQQEQQLLTYLLTWMAYAPEGSRPLTLGAAQALIEYAQSITNQNVTIRVQDQVSGRLAGILAMSVIPYISPGETDEGKDLADTDINVVFQERSLREFFVNHKDSREKKSTSIIPSQLKAYKLMVHLTAAILTDPEPEPSGTEALAKAQLKSAAAHRWASQFVAGMKSVEGEPTEFPKEASRAELFKYFSAPLVDPSAIRHLEDLVDVYEYDTPFCSVFGSTEESAQECLELMKQHKDAKFVSDLLEGLGRLHIQSWISASTGSAAYQALRFAHYALYKSGKFETLSEVLEEESSNEIHRVPELVLGTGKFQAKHYQQEAMVFHFIDHAQDAINSAKEGLKIKETREEAFELTYRVARSSFDLWSTETPHNTQETLDALNEAVAAWEAIEPRPEDVEGLNTRFQNNANTMYQMKARLEVEGTDASAWQAAMESMKAAKKAKPEGFEVRFFGEMIDALGGQKAWEEIFSLLDLLTNPLSNMHERKSRAFIHKAAVACGRQTALRSLYEQAAKNPDPYGLRLDEIRLDWALFERFVMSSNQKAKELIWDNLNSEECNDESARNSACALADILVDEFLTSTTLKGKQDARASLEAVARELDEREGEQPGPRERLSPIAASVAIMQSRLLGAQEFRDEAVGILQAVKAALSDHRVGNDREALCQAARVLALVPRCEEDAKTALMCRAFNVTATLSERTEPGAQPDIDPEDSDAEEIEPEDEVVCCDGCYEFQEPIDSGHRLYTCLYCTEVNLCSGCYNERVRQREARARKRDGLEDAQDVGEAGQSSQAGQCPYVEICPLEHLYLEFPPEEWSGLVKSGGKIHISHVSKSFNDWRDGLGAAWQENWEKRFCNISPHDLGSETTGR